MSNSGYNCDVQEGCEGGTRATAAARRQQHPRYHRSVRHVAGPLRPLVVRFLRSHGLPGSPLLIALLLLQLRCT